MAFFSSIIGVLYENTLKDTNKLYKYHEQDMYIYYKDNIRTITSRKITLSCNYTLDIVLISVGGLCCYSLPTPMTFASWGRGQILTLVVHQPASPSIWQTAVHSPRRGTSRGDNVVRMWCSGRDDVCRVCEC